MKAPYLTLVVATLASCAHFAPKGESTTQNDSEITIRMPESKISRYKGREWLTIYFNDRDANGRPCLSEIIGVSPLKKTPEEAMRIYNSHPRQRAPSNGNH